MNYTDRLDYLIKNINTNLIDFSQERKRNSPPTQVSSEFLTNKEQGDWAEDTLIHGINNNSERFIAVKYGKSDNIIAGEDGFKEFFENYQNELDTIGKRPDILLFEKKDFPYRTTNISNWPLQQLDKIVPRAKCGIEVRSSAFLINKYEAYMNEKQNNLIKNAMNIKKDILTYYSELLKTKDIELFKIINMLSLENIHVINYRTPCWRTTTDLEQLCKLLKDLKSNLSEISKRTFLSITPKVEDLKVVYNWVKKYNVPHYYVQVFFDKAYGISYEKILELIGNSDLENKAYYIESDVKNQNKTTIKICANKEACVLKKVEQPEHYSVLKELCRGRLLYYVKFKNSLSVIDYEQFENLFGIKL